MASQVLWMLDNEISGKRFERLCADLLYCNGFRDIVPTELQDGGRDAEEFPRKGRDREGCAAFFQFSLEKNWKKKLVGDARKLSDRRNEFSTFVFVTSQTARTVDVDLLKTSFRREYGWTLVVFSREWLRLQLEVAHPDLAKKYLDVDLSSLSEPSGAAEIPEGIDERVASVWKQIGARQYEAAVADLKKLLQEQPESDAAWQALAWTHYCLHQLNEALAEINRALKLKENSHSISIRACILVEKGIGEKNRESVCQGLQLFEHLLATISVHPWHIFYNLGNALSALGRHQEAIARYKQALDLEQNIPDIWKNLASSYHLAGDHGSEMECFGKALELDPLKPEALVSKAVSLMIDFRKPEEALLLLETALRCGLELPVRWPQIWYWLATAYLRNGRLQDCLKSVDNGLAHRPGDPSLRKLKSHVFVKLVQNGAFSGDARSFWKAELFGEPLNYQTRGRLVHLEAERGDMSTAWDLLDECFGLVELTPSASLQTSECEISECITALRFLPQYAMFRSSFPVSDYWDHEDPLYDLPFAPPPGKGIQEALTTLFALPFGVGFDYFEKQSSRDSKASLRKLFDELRRGIEHAVTEAGRLLAATIPTREGNNKETAAKITDILLLLCLVALREFGRQRGWIASQYRIPSECLDKAMEGYNESQIERNVMSKVIMMLNQELKIFPSNRPEGT